MAPTNLSIVRLAIKIFNRDWQALGAGATLWADAIDPNVVWEENDPAFFGLERVYVGHEGLVRWFREVLEPWDFYAIDEVGLTEIGNTVVAQIRLQGRGKESGAEVDMTVCNVFSFRDGRIVRRQLFHDRADALRAAEELEGRSSG